MTYSEKLRRWWQDCQYLELVIYGPIAVIGGIFIALIALDKW